MKIKTMSSLTLIVAVVILFVANIQLHASETDNRIESSAKKSYVFKTYLKRDMIKVRSTNGVVTLSGSVPDYAHKSMAEETVLGLAGVKSVENQLVVTGVPPGVNTDAWIHDRIKGSLLMHRSVSAANTDVSVIDNNVILRGTAISNAQKDLTTEYANDVSGVKTVDNQMTVVVETAKSKKKAENIDDASITTQVKMSLMYNEGTEMLSTKVSTYEGIVTLRGTAKNQDEIDRTTKRVNDVHGVKSVNNEMTIELTTN